MMKKLLLLMTFFYGACFADENFSGITYKEGMSIKDVLNQTDINHIAFFPGCFNCPSRIEISDTLIVSRPQDNYTTTFSIDGYNTEYINFVTKSTFPQFVADSDEHYSYMDKMEEISSITFNNEKFKHKAIKTYDLTKPVYNVVIQNK